MSPFRHTIILDNCVAFLLIYDSMMEMARKKEDL